MKKSLIAVLALTLGFLLMCGMIQAQEKKYVGKAGAHHASRTSEQPDLGLPL
jgi:hypothetical protein